MPERPMTEILMEIEELWERLQGLLPPDERERIDGSAYPPEASQALADSRRPPGGMTGWQHNLE